MGNGLSRREFLKAAGAGGALLLDGPAVRGVFSEHDGQEDPPPERSQMNFIVVILDSLRKDHVGVYGNDWIQTPNLDEFATQSLRFTRAYPESIPTLPVRRAIHTGRRTWPFKEPAAEPETPVTYRGWHPIPSYQTTLAQILAQNGHKTLLVTDTYHQWKPSMNYNRGFELFRYLRGQERDDYQPYWAVSEEEMDRYLRNDDTRTRSYLANVADRGSEEDYFAPRVFTEASKVLESVQGEEPFFMVVDSFDPHEPWDPPEEFVKLYHDGYDRQEPITPSYDTADYLDEEQLERMRALYAGEVTMTDRWLGRFLDKIDEEGLAQNTLVMLLSDHGHPLGEHGYTGKPSAAMWQEITDIPFMIRHPEGKGAGRTSDFYASTHDIAPTILSMAGLEPPEPMDGEDLSGILEDGEEPESRPYFTMGFDDHVWARDEEYVMFCHEDGSQPHLYDAREDPEQKNDLAEEKPEIITRMLEDYIRKEEQGEQS